MAEEHLSPREATRKSMDQITGALVGIALVLAAVCRADGVLRWLRRCDLSAVLRHARFGNDALSAHGTDSDACAVRDLAEAACPRSGHVEHKGFFGWFNRTFDRGRTTYERGLVGALSRPKRMLLVYTAVVIAMGVLFVRIPTSFLPPPEDAGFLYGQVQTAAGRFEGTHLGSLRIPRRSTSWRKRAGPSKAC